MDNRAVYVILQVENTTIGVLNVYAPTSTLFISVMKVAGALVSPNGITLN